MIDDATSRFRARFAEHDSTEENLRTLELWLRRYGRPVEMYTDKNSIFPTTRPVQWAEQLEGKPAQTQFERALRELGIRLILAHSPQAKGRIERLFGTLQDRLGKHARYYWLLLAESHLTRRLFGAMVGRIEALTIRTG